MKQKHNPKSDLRGAFTMRELRNAKRIRPAGPVGVFIQVTLAITFMYLLVIAYMMMGITGAVLVSLMFLLSVFIPVLYELAKLSWRRKTSNANKKSDIALKPETENEG